jgi:hypothetical protein
MPAAPLVNAKVRAKVLGDNNEPRQKRKGKKDECLVLSPYLQGDKGRPAW